MFVETTTTRIEYILQTFLINNGVWLYSHQNSERYLKKYNNNSVLSGENSAFSKKKTLQFLSCSNGDCFPEQTVAVNCK